MKTLNLGILAHVDAGKTSLSERLLFENCLIQTLGSVDKGNTQTDSLTLEKERGITIQSAVVSFNLKNLKINLIDTPGHADFVAEVERTLNILDAVILVISAVEGIQSQTRILTQVLKKLKIPTLIFINKIDRVGAKNSELIAEIQAKLFPKIITLNKVNNIGTLVAKTIFLPIQTNLDKLKKEIGKMESCPLIFGSSITGAGISELISTLDNYFEPIEEKYNLPLAGVVFKIEINSKGQKTTYIRLFQGELKTRQTISVIRIDQNGEQTNFVGKITKMQGFENGKVLETKTVKAPEIVKIWGLDLQIGDWLGESLEKKADHFTKPNLEVVIRNKNPVETFKLHTALSKLSLQDPLISFQQKQQNTFSLKLYGEVQQEIIQAFLLQDYGLEVIFEKIQVICIEKVVGIGTSFADKMDKDNFFEATIGLKISPNLTDNGVIFDIGIGRGHLPVAFQKAIEETVYKTLEQGLYGWSITDCLVEITTAGYWDATSDGGDFRGLTPILLQKALKQAGTEVYEPVNYFELEFLTTNLNPILSVLTKIGAKIDSIVENLDNMTITGTISVRQTFDLEKQIPALTSGKGLFLTKFSGYQKVLNTTKM
jgi:ribosomal protection tetracycline resistance protein